MGLVKQTPVSVQPVGILTSAFNKQNFGRVATSLQNFRLIGRLFAKRRTSETRQSYFGHPVFCPSGNLSSGARVKVQ